MSQLTLSLFLVGFGISQYIFGVISDRFGRKPLLIIGICIYVLGSILLLTSMHISLLLLGRLIQGLGIGAAGSISRIIVADVFSGHMLVKMFSFFSIFVVLVLAVAPALGGFIQQYVGFRGNFTFMLLYGVLILILILAALPETLKAKDHHAIKLREIMDKYRVLLVSRGFVGNIVSNGLSLSIVIVSATILPFLMQHEFLITPKNYGLLTLLMASGMAVGMYCNSKLVSTIHSNRMPLCGLGIVILSAICLGVLTYVLGPHLIILIVTVLFFYFGVALVLPNVAAAIFHPYPKMVGLVGATYGALQILISAAAGSMAILLQTSDPIEYASMVFVIASLAWLVQFSVLKQHES